MARGYDLDQERKSAVSKFGKNLVRRSRSTCELCEAADTKLSIFEVPPVPVEPNYDICIMICDTCRTQIENPKHMDANHWRCLNGSVWSEIPPVQVMSVRLLKALSEQFPWATEIVDQLYLDHDIQTWIDKE